MRRILCVIVCAWFMLSATAGDSPPFENYLYTSAGDLERIRPLLDRPDIAGVQVVYPWKLLEADKGRYDFSAIQQDLALLQSHRKKMFIQLQDRFFSPDAKNVPLYLMTDPTYGGGMVPQKDNPGENKPQVSGWVAQQWNPPLRKRYQSLIRALGERFDGVIVGINLPETAIDLDKNAGSTGFTCDKYFDAEMENLSFARSVFRRSAVVQYMNFWPCEWNNDHDYMGRAFALAARIGAGVGGPDIVPYRKAQMDNSYPFFFRYRGKLKLVAMAVQEPTLTYRNPQTGKVFSRQEFEDFGRNYLGAQIIFWSPSAPWLSKGRVPVLNRQ